jgi:hypothetical protein
MYIPMVLKNYMMFIFRPPGRPTQLYLADFEGLFYNKLTHTHLNNKQGLDCSNRETTLFPAIPQETLVMNADPNSTSMHVEAYKLSNH